MGVNKEKKTKHQLSEAQTWNDDIIDHAKHVRWDTAKPQIELQIRVCSPPCPIRERPLQESEKSGM